jgi:hypothetical protein
MQKTTTQFKSECGKAQCFVENDMPIGLFHDFLMGLKGLMVDRMVAAHQEQTTQAEAMKELPPPEAVHGAEEVPELDTKCEGACNG